MNFQYRGGDGMEQTRISIRGKVEFSSRFSLCGSCQSFILSRELPLYLKELVRHSNDCYYWDREIGGEKGTVACTGSSGWCSH